jgi:dimethylargininase
VVDTRRHQHLVRGKPSLWGNSCHREPVRKGTKRVVEPVYRYNSAIVRRPARSVVHGLRADDRGDPTFEGVAAEHASYVEALEKAGVRVTLLPALEAFPDSVFVEDPALVFPGAAILLRPGAASREREGEFLRPALEAAFDTVLDLPHGFADGGDVLVMPEVTYIGLSARTDRAGAEALAGLLDQIGRKAVVVETPQSVLHLKTASSLIDEETVLATADLAATGVFDALRVIEVPRGEEAGANVLRANDTILAGGRFPRILDLLDGHGARLTVLDNAEIEKIDAGFTCMSLRS